jgi:hypothetical protein
VQLNDTWGVAGLVNALSDSARTYFAAGGLGILIGDGQLTRYGTEDIIETFYSPLSQTGWRAVQTISSSPTQHIRGASIVRRATRREGMFSTMLSP